MNYEDIGGLLGFGESEGMKLHTATVTAKNGNVLELGADGIEAVDYCGASVGDVVTVLVTPNGDSVAVGKMGGAGLTIEKVATWDTSYTGWSQRTGSLYVIPQLRVAFFRMYATLNTTATNSGRNLVVIPDGYRPSVVALGLSCSSTANAVAAHARITNDTSTSPAGKWVKVFSASSTAIASGNEVYVSGSWVY